MEEEVKDDLEKIELMKFVTPLEFYNNKEIIKVMFNSLSKKGKEIYKWYFFYELCMYKIPVKEALWDYLNLDNQDIDMFFVSNMVHQFANVKQNDLIRSQNTEIDNLLD